MGKPEGAVFVDQAMRLEEFLSQHIEVIERYDSSQQGSAAKLFVLNPPVADLIKPRKDFMTSLIAYLRDLTYTDSTTKV
jgi:F0F1-type ATP synthase beta subunit